MELVDFGADSLIKKETDELLLTQNVSYIINLARITLQKFS